MRRNTDFLKEFQTVVLVGLVAVAIGTVIGLVDLLNGGPIRAEMTVGASADPGLAEGVTADPIGELSVEISSPTSRQRLLYALTQVPTAIVLLTALSLLALTLRRARRSDPFTARIVRDLRLTGVALWGGILATAIEFMAGFMLSETVTPDEWRFTLQVPVGWVFAGFVCFAVAEIVRRGIGMRDYLETVV